MLKKILDFLLFSSLFIAICAILMSWQTIDLFELNIQNSTFLSFVFLSTITSYNLHWYLSIDNPVEQRRIRWTKDHHHLHLILMIAGSIGVIWYGWQLRTYWIELSLAIFLTFLYTAPKIPFRYLKVLKKIAIGKTLFLTFVWTYVTAVLPLLISEKHINTASILFCLQRFFLVYAICIIFDYRDRIHDRKDGIRSLITLMPARIIRIIFYLSLLLFAVCAILLTAYDFSLLNILFILIPGFITGLIYNRSIKSNSDYLYYGILDGLMMLSALFTSFPSF